MRYWLLKSEPSTFSVDDLSKRPKQTEGWDGVRNYQARNYICEMQVRDLAFFYHSSCEVPGIVGIVEIIKSAYPDGEELDAHGKPRWYKMNVRLVRKFNELISLQELRKNSALKNMILLRKGNRLSIMPVTTLEWQAIEKMESGLKF